MYGEFLISHSGFFDPAPSTVFSFSFFHALLKARIPFDSSGPLKPRFPFSFTSDAPLMIDFGRPPFQDAPFSSDRSALKPWNDVRTRATLVPPSGRHPFCRSPNVPPAAVNPSLDFLPSQLFLSIFG